MLHNTSDIFLHKCTRIFLFDLTLQNLTQVSRVQGTEIILCFYNEDKECEPRVPADTSSHCPSCKGVSFLGEFPFIH